MNLLKRVRTMRWIVSLSIPALALCASAAMSLDSTIRLEAASTNADALKHLDLERGKSVFVKTSYPVKRVSVGDPDVLDVIVLSQRELQLVPKTIGATNFLIWDPRGSLQAAIDVQVGTANAQIEREIARILSGGDVHVEAAGESILLTGHVPSPLVMDQALAVANSFFPAEDGPKVVNLLEVGGDQQVMIEIKIAEVSRSLTRDMGTNLQALFESNGNPVRILSLLDGLTSLDPEAVGAAGLLVSDQVNLIGGWAAGTAAIEVAMNIMHQNGLGKVLAEPTLVARSGENATFLAGGEVPIPVAQGGAFGSITIEYKQFGVGVNFTPTVLDDDRIHLKISPEVSEPDFTLGTSIEGTFIPAFNTRRAATSVELGDGQSFAIAGLLSDRVRSLVTKYPVLGDVPIIGALFRSSKFQRNETELVIIVTPRLVQPLEPGKFDLPTDHYIEPTDIEFYLLGQIEGRRWGMWWPREQARVEHAEQLHRETTATGGLLGTMGHQIVARPEGDTE